MVGLVVVSVLLNRLYVHLPEVLQVSLVASYGQHDVLGGVLPQLADPLLYFFETLRRSDVIGDDGSHGLSVVDRGNCVVLFLPCSVLHGGGDTQMASLTLWWFSRTSFFSR